MINHEHNFIFIGIGKNASSSIVQFFSDLEIPLEDGQHKGVANLHDYLNKKYKDSSARYFKFAFVRNPFDRLLSAYQEFKRPDQFHDVKSILEAKTFPRHIVRLHRYNTRIYQPSTMQKIRLLGIPELRKRFKFFKSRLTKVDSFESFAKMAFQFKHIHWQSQYETLFYRGKQLVDFIGKVENIDNDLKLICQKLGIECTATVKRIRSSERGCYTEAYTEELRRLVTEHYQQDLRQFGYEYGSPH